MKRAIALACFALFTIPAAAFAQPTAGIPAGGIWFSKVPFYIGDTVSVNTLLFNATKDVLRGSVELLDGSVVIQQKDVALDAGDYKVVDFPIQATRGKHSYHIRIGNNDLLGPGGTLLSLKSAEYTAKTPALAYEPVENPVLSATTSAATSSGPVATAPIVPITHSDTEQVADSVEKVLPAKVVEPVVGVAAPVIGLSESLRVGQANGANQHIVNTISDIAKAAGVSSVLGTSTQLLLQKAKHGGVIASSTPKISPWSIFRGGFSNGNFVKTPFGYIELFVLLVYQWVMATAWVFYLICALVLWRALLFVKRLIFNRGE